MDGVRKIERNADVLLNACKDIAFLPTKLLESVVVQDGQHLKKVKKAQENILFDFNINLIV